MDYFYTEVLKIYLASYAIATAIAHNPRYSVYERWYVINKMAFNLTLQYVGVYAIEILFYESGLSSLFNVGLIMKFIRLNLFVTAGCYMWTMLLINSNTPVGTDFVSDMVDMRRTMNLAKNEGRGFTDRVYMGCEYESGTDAAGFVRGLITTEIGQDTSQSFASKCVWAIEVFVSNIMSNIDTSELSWLTNTLVAFVQGAANLPVVSHVLGCFQVFVSMVISFLFGFGPADYVFKRAMQKAYVPPAFDNLTEEQKIVRNYVSGDGLICSSGAWLNFVQTQVGHTKVDFKKTLINYASAMDVVLNSDPKFTYLQDQNFNKWCRQRPKECDLFNENFITEKVGSLAAFTGAKVRITDALEEVMHEKFFRWENIDLNALDLLGLDTTELRQNKEALGQGDIPEAMIAKAMGVNNYETLSRIYARSTLVPSFNCASNSVDSTHKCCQGTPTFDSAIPDNGDIVYVYENGASAESRRIARRFFV